jgi:type VII secretion protein EccB
MPAQVTTRAQVNGHRFLTRRLEHALIRGDSRMIHDPMRGHMRALLVGVVAAVVITGAAGVMAFFKPTPNLGDAQILISKASGAMYVRIGDQVHPVLNIASARMIVGQRDEPKQVDDRFLNTLPRGPMVGIIGAPVSISGGDDMSMSSWTVCDTLDTPAVTQTTGLTSVQTTVLANDPVLGPDVRAADPSAAVLADVGGLTYLIYDGVRAQIDLADPVVANGLHLQGATPRPVSLGLFNAFPQVDPIKAVAIDGVGQPSTVLPPSYPIGSILRTEDSRGQQLYVLLRDGIQPVSAAAADVIRYGEPDAAAAGGDARDVAPATIASVPVVDTLPVARYPSTSPHLVAPDPDRVICMGWQRANNAAAATIRLLLGDKLPLPTDAAPVRLATADGGGPALDFVYLKPGTGEYVQATGGSPDSGGGGQLFYVSDTGLRYHVKDVPTANALGVTGVPGPDRGQDVPQLAPWSVISLLPPGPDLSQEAALVAHDGMAADPDSSKVTVPKG